MIQGVSQASAKATGFGEDLFSCQLIEGQDQFLMFQGGEESHIVLVIDHNDGQCGPQQFQDSSSRSGIEFLTTDPQQEPL